MRLIDADKLIEEANQDGAYGYVSAAQIDNAPTIDAVEALGWVPIKTRPMDEEERKEWSERLGYDIEYEEAVLYMNLPDDGDEVLVCNKRGYVYIDTFCQEESGCYFESGGDMDGVIAWMPLPEPYKPND